MAFYQFTVHISHDEENLKQKTESVLCQKRPNFWQIRGRDCGSPQEPRACPPCDATPPLCSTAQWGRPGSEHALAPRTLSCGHPGSTAGPAPLPVSSWRWWMLSSTSAGSGTRMTTMMMRVVLMDTVVTSSEEKPRVHFNTNILYSCSTLVRPIKILFPGFILRVGRGLRFIITS